MRRSRRQTARVVGGRLAGDQLRTCAHMATGANTVEAAGLNAGFGVCCCFFLPAGEFVHRAE